MYCTLKGEQAQSHYALLCWFSSCFVYCLLCLLHDYYLEESQHIKESTGPFVFRAVVGFVDAVEEDRMSAFLIVRRRKSLLGGRVGPTFTLLLVSLPGHCFGTASPMSIDTLGTSSNKLQCKGDEGSPRPLAVLHAGTHIFLPRTWLGTRPKFTAANAIIVSTASSGRQQKVSSCWKAGLSAPSWLEPSQSWSPFW